MDLKTRRLKLPISLILELAAFSMGALPAAHAAKELASPEQEAARLARVLKPIPDEQWTEIAGARITEKYEIAKGDTLYDISKRLFGDSKYWPKIWALNNSGITNPHLIRPGRLIAFLPGTGSSLPAVAVSDAAAPVVGASTPATSSAALSEDLPSPMQNGSRANEWSKLPRQPWENFQLQLPPDVDPLGFDKRNRITFGKPPAFDLDFYASSERIETLGELMSSQAPNVFLGTNDSVFIRSEGAIQVGETYGITSEPFVLQAGTFSRKGFCYPLLGKVKILGVRDELFIGRITANRGFIPRNSLIVALPPRVRIPEPVPGPSQIEGTLLLDKIFSTSTAAQHKQVFIDRGSDDGVQVGMVFRSYQHRDPVTGKQILESDAIINGDLIVVQVTPKFSSAIVLRSFVELPENARVVLLTDVSDLKKKPRKGPVTLDKRQLQQDIDVLENIEAGGALGRKEEKELKQLERWAPAPAPTEPAPPPSDAAPEEVAPSDESALPPPPPPEGEPSSEAIPPPPETAPPPPAPPGGESDLPPPPVEELPPTEEVPPPPPPGS